MTVFSTDREIIQTAINWIDTGYQPVLVTVAKTWGSSPRPRGSMMIMREDGIHFGSVSGGCVEEDLVERYRRGQLSDRYPSLVDYGVQRQDALRFGLPCGGRLELIIEQLHSSKPWQTLLQKIDTGESVERRLCMNTGEASLHGHSIITEFDYTTDAMVKVFGPDWDLLLIGAGHLSRYVAGIALMLNYKVTICDPREEYRSGWELQGVHFSSEMPDDAVKGMGKHQRGIVVALTHDPKLDDMALMEALQYDLFYVGALGSLRSSKQRKERLLELGITTAQLENLHAPVGLAIGSHTPPEIAVSIMAEIIAKRNNCNLKQP